MLKLVTVVAGFVLALGAPGASSVAPPAASAAYDALRLLQQDGLVYQDSVGYLGAKGPAEQIKTAAAELTAGHVGNTVLFTGAGETGTAFLIVSGNDLPPTLDFQVIGMTAANVENNTAQLDAVYSDDGSELDAAVPAGTDVDITPVDIDYAVYPPGYVPPPDNHGLNPTAQFVF